MAYGERSQQQAGGPRRGGPVSSVLQLGFGHRKSLQTSWESDSQAYLALMQDEDLGHLSNSN